MDNLILSQKLVLGFTANPRTNAIISKKPLSLSFKIPKTKFKSSISAASEPSQPIIKSDATKHNGKSDEALKNDPTVQKTGSQNAISGDPESLKLIAVMMDVINLLAKMSELFPGSRAAPHTPVSKSDVLEVGTDATNNGTSDDPTAQNTDSPNVISGNPGSFNFKHMMDFMKDYVSNSPEVIHAKELVEDYLGMTVEEIRSKVEANPGFVKTIQNPRVRRAINHCFENPMLLSHYQNDKEVMDAFNKFEEIFPKLIHLLPKELANQLYKSD